MTKDAADLLVEKYRILRQDDSTGVGKNSYRITVRQLESMIRLSEAIARANCSAEITPRMVREAYNLLRQSIIHVEQDDVDLDRVDDDDAPGAGPGGGGGGPGGPGDDEDGDGDEQMDTGEDSMMSDVHSLPQNAAASSTQPSTVPGAASSSQAPAPAPAGPTRKFKITHDQYMSMQSAIVLYVHQKENETGAGVDRDELIDWYLESKETEVTSTEELDYEKELVLKVLKRLCKVRANSVCYDAKDKMLTTKTG